jgi:alkylhydroperoxidase/carboxymuconolactone decarboxylase family protein YurZ
MGYDGALVQDYLRKSHESSLLTDREKHLVGLAVTLTRGCQVCTRNRIDKARSAGIGDDVVNALVDVVAAVNAGVAAATAREGFRLADASPAEACDALCSPDGSGGRSGAGRG